MIDDWIHWKNGCAGTSTDHVGQNNKEDFPKKNLEHETRSENNQRWYDYRAGKREPATAVKKQRIAVDLTGRRRRAQNDLRMMMPLDQCLSAECSIDDDM